MQQRPFVNYYAPTFILYELSSPFLNIHWFCDKLNMTGSKIQLYNGFINLLGIESPGLTSCLAIGEEVDSLLYGSR